MLNFIAQMNLVVSLLFTVLYLYQIVYAIVAFFHKQSRGRLPKAKKLHKIGVVISARNESSVIGQLLRSIQAQKYPRELVQVFVVADNCTDKTAEVCRREGAIVYERFNSELIGKGYALDYLFKHILAEHEDCGCEAFLILDADNLLDENYLAEMNKTFDRGFRIATSYRNSKNYDSNWISAGYSLWFLRESEYLNYPRMLMGTSCAVSGTGFLVDAAIIRKNYGWKHFLLTEDIEFTIDTVISGERVGYSADAMLYDEQPKTFLQSWNQRMRWAKGFYQVFRRYGKDLVKNMFKRRNFACFDMLMTIAPALIITITTLTVNTGFLLYGICNPSAGLPVAEAALLSIAKMLIGYYLILFGLGLLTTLTEWKKIQCSPLRKIMFTFTFPCFMLTYIPIAICALFKKVKWVPIQHTVVKSLEDVR